MQDISQASPKKYAMLRRRRGHRRLESLAALKPAVKRVSLAAKKRVEEKHREERQRKTLSQFCTSSAKWEVSVRNLETFMVRLDCASESHHFTHPFLCIVPELSVRAKYSSSLSGFGDKMEGRKDLFNRAIGFPRPTQAAPR